MLDASLVGWQIDVRWRYWITDPETQKRKSYYIWCTGEIEQVANGTTDKRSPACRNLLDAGAVRIKWPEDKERKERESYTWIIFQNALWNQDKHLGWRFSAAELKKRAAAAEPAAKRRK